MSYPATFEADYVERRSRLTTFLRIILLRAYGELMPHGRYPGALYELVAGFNRSLARVTAYALLLADPYPPFGGGDIPDYPVRMRFDGPLPHYSRLRTLFRFILAIPIVILRYAINLLLEIGAIAAWFVIVITGKLPRGLFDVMVLANSYTARSDAYLYLLTETYPPFQDEHTRAAGSADPPGTRPPPPAAPPPPAPTPPAGPSPPGTAGPAGT